MKRTGMVGAFLVVILLTGVLVIGGTVPVSARKPKVHDPILIDGDDAFTHRNGVSKGKGTLLSPYIIDDLEINASVAFCLQCGRAAGIEIRNTNSYFIVRNVYIHSGALASYGNAGIKLYNVSNGRVEFSSFHANAVGILATYARNVVIDQNVFLQHDWGIAFSQSNEITISGNQVTVNGVDGISIGEVKSGRVRVLENVVSGSGLSGIMTFATNAEVSGNTVYDNAWFGIYDLSDDSTILNNNFHSNGRVGVQIASGNVTVSGNSIAGNDLGVRIWSYGMATLIGNEISANNVGVESALSSGSSAVAFVYHNNFLLNGINAWPGPNVQWDAEYPAGGNYWSDYVGTDQCSGQAQDVCTGPDGIGDTPYFSQGTELDRYPLMTPFI